MNGIGERLDAIERRVAALRAYDTRREVFGAARSGEWGHDYAPGAPMPAEALAALERDHGVVLPPSFRALLARLGDGGAGPYYGRLPLEPLELDALPQNAVEASLDGEVVASYATGPREVPSAVSSLARPFLLDGPWSPESGSLPVPAGASPYDGCVKLAEQGCGYFDFLVVNGPRRGEVWSDFTAGDGSIGKTHDDVLEWYEAWLDRAELEWIEKSAARIVQGYDDPHPGVVAYKPKLEAVLAGQGSGWADGWRALGYARMNAGPRSEALAAFEKAAEIGEEEPAQRLLLDRARLAAAEGQHEDALERIREGLAYERIWASTRTELMDARVDAFDALGRADDALVGLRDLADDAFWTLQYHHELARRLLGAGRSDEAIAVLEDAVTRDIGPERGLVMATRESVYRGLIDDLDASGEHDAAARLRAVLAASVNEPEA